MELRIYLHDHTGKEHGRERCRLHNQATLEDLKGELQEKFQIEAKYQHLWFGDQRLDFDFDSKATLSEMNLSNNSELILKHASLPIWSALLKAAGNFNILNDEVTKTRLYNNAMGLINQLDSAEFYSTYSEFLDDGTKIHKRFVTSLDRTRQKIEKSAKTHFLRKFRKDNPHIEFTDPEDGTRSGCVCHITIGEDTIKYFIKTPHDAGDSRSSVCYDLNLNELFVYKLLQELGVGAEIEFILDDCGSLWTVYIASKEIKNFSTVGLIEIMKENEEKAETEPTELIDLNQYVKPVVQMLALYTIMELGDHHKENMGVNANGSPFILDFFFVPRYSFNVMGNFYDGVKCGYYEKLRINDLIATLKQEERVKIAQEFLETLNFEAKLDTALQHFLDEHTKFWDDAQFKFKSTKKTNDLKTYVEKIRSNLSVFNAFRL